MINNKSCLPIFMLLTIFSFTSHARVFQIEKQVFKIKVPKNWQVAKHMFGSTLTLLGPYKKHRRPVMTLEGLPIKSHIFNKKKLENSQVAYQQERKQWLEKNKGEHLSFTKYAVLNWKSLGEVHTIGHSYKSLGNVFFEQSYFFNCNDNLYNISTLMTRNQKSMNNQTMQKIFNSIECEK